MRRRSFTPSRRRERTGPRVRSFRAGARVGGDEAACAAVDGRRVGHGTADARERRGGIDLKARAELAAAEDEDAALRLALLSLLIRPQTFDGESPRTRGRERRREVDCPGHYD